MKRFIALLLVLLFIIPTIAFADKKSEPCIECNSTSPSKITPNALLYGCCCYKRTYICLYCSSWVQIIFWPGCGTKAPHGCEWRTRGCCQYPCPTSIRII